jgi:hypothetical protein
MTDADNLPMTFGCGAQVGTSGSNYELPMNALEEGVSETLGGPGQCNENFLRDEALLVIVIVTDEADGPGDPDMQTSTGSPQTWYDTVVATKQGFSENVAVLSLVSYAEGPCPPLHPAYDGQNIVDFTELFAPNGVVGGVCEPDYGPFFEGAIEVIEDACHNFVPLG